MANADLLLSVGVGLVIAVGVACMPNFEANKVKSPGDVTNKEIVENSQQQEEENEKQIEEMTEVISSALQHKPHLRKFFGLDDKAPHSTQSKVNDSPTQDNVHPEESESSDNPWINTPDPNSDEEKEKLRNMIRKAQSSEMQDDEVTEVLFRAVMGVVMIGGLVYSANVMSKGEVARFLVGMFPVEAAALGLKASIEQVS